LKRIDQSAFSILATTLHGIKQSSIQIRKMSVKNSSDSPRKKTRVTKLCEKIAGVTSVLYQG